MLKKTILAFLIATIALTSVFAQDDWGDSGDDWGDGSSSGASSSSSESSAGGFWDKFTISGDATLDARYQFESDDEADKNNEKDIRVKAIPNLELGLDYEGESTNFNAQINLSERTLLNNKMDILDEFHADLFLGDFVFSAGKMKVVWGKGDKLHVLDNFNANDYSDFLIPDYLDRRLGEYMFRIQYNSPVGFRLEGIYTPVMRSENYATSGRWVPSKSRTIKGLATDAGGTNVGLALAAKDTAFATFASAKSAAETAGAAALTAKTAAEKAGATLQAANAAVVVAGGMDKATPAQLKALSDAKTALETAKTTAESAGKTFETAKTAAETAGTAYEKSIANYIAILNSTSSMSADDLYPNTNDFEYGQFGFYGNFSIGMIDFGLSYYNGHYKQVSCDLSSYLASKKYNADPANATQKKPVAMPEFHYDKLQVFGLDAQTAAGPFTFRGEFAYNLTNDTAGDDPWVRNNSISYLFGFDTGLPIHNLNLNLQGTGNFVLNSGEIKDSKFKTYDVDYDPTNCYCNNKLVVQLKDTFYYEKIEVLVKGIYGIERKDLVLMPEFSYKIRDGWKAKLSGLYIHNFGDDEDSEFAGWLDNSFIQLSVNYTF